MKKLMRKLLALVAAMTMVLGMSGLTAFAQTVPADEPNQNGTGTITVTNASKGETYTIYKLFDASVTGTKDGAIAYTGTIPEGLSDYFEYVNGKDGQNGITAKVDAKTGDSMSDGLRRALTTWANAQTQNAGSIVSDGSSLTFESLAYGYYVVKTTQGDQAITVTSTNPNAEIVDKNSTTPVTNLRKNVDDDDVNIGQTVNYTVSFGTANYTGSGKDAKQIVSYKIEDTLPESFLTDVVVDSITVITGSDDTAEKTAITNTDGKAPQFTNKTITIPWVDTNGANLYVNGATLEIKYHATVADTATIAGAGNTNKVTVTPQTKDGDDTPNKSESEKTISTYAIALKKTDDKGNPLAGATFKLPFYVKTATANDGSYIYAGAKTTTSIAPAGTTDELTTPSTGEITIKGVASGSYNLTETEAPKGYNKLTDQVTVEAQKLTTTKTSTTFFIDANGNKTDEKTDTSVTYTNNNIAASAVLVINKTGAELPSTGGMGTTIFYVLGAALVIGAGVVLVTRRRMSK